VSSVCVSLISAGNDGDGFDERREKMFSWTSLTSPVTGESERRRTLQDLVSTFLAVLQFLNLPNHSVIS